MVTNFEELQAAWKAADRKLTAQKTLNEKLVMSIIRERSGSTLVVMSRKNLGMAALFLVYAILFIALIAGNAFDYEHPLYYIPLVIQGITCLVFALLLFKTYRNINSIKLSREDLATALRKVIRVNDQHVVLSQKIWWCYFIAGVVFPFTFLPAAASQRGMTEALGLIAIPVVIIGLLVLIAKKLYLFRDKNGDRLKKNLRELEEYLAELERA